MSIFLGLGGNLPGPAGPPPATLAAALDRLKRLPLRLLRRSRWYRSPAWPDPADPEFVNAVVEVETALGAGDLLRALLGIEEALGRVRGQKNAPRTLDIDLLDYQGAVEAAPDLVLPHPRLHLRPFVLLPLAEIAPDWRHPVSRRGIKELIAALAAGAWAEPLP
jgi:2-amino-4-hydroxy-6-hydroxymethyldihydropteridine diphosphokinase